jgi:hypothetical protein
MYDSYVAAGGPGRLVAFGNFMSDAHNILGMPEGLQLWAPKVDAFLAKLDLPNKVLYPQYLPTAFPAPSHFAAIDDVEAVPYLNSRIEAKNMYRKFLDTPMPRVFVVAPSGYMGIDNGGFDPIGRGISRCNAKTSGCGVYAVDDYVTWDRPLRPPSPHLAAHFAVLTDASALPHVNDGGREGYRKFLTMGKPRAFVIAPDGAWSASGGGEDAIAAAMQACTKAHQECKLYAVDDDVVWNTK